MDSGGQEHMLKKYGQHSPVLFELRKWYITECERFGQAELGSLSSKYDAFDNGTKISKPQRVLFRERLDLKRRFPDPFSTLEKGGYQMWYAQNSLPEADNYRSLSVKPGVGFIEVVSDMADYFSYTARSGKTNSRLERFLLHIISGGMRFMVRLVR